MTDNGIVRDEDRETIVVNEEAGENGASDGSSTGARGFIVPVWLGIALVAAATFFAYANSLRGEFLFDDYIDVLDQVALRRLWPIWDAVVVRTSDGWGFRSRPVAGYSFLLNYALCKRDAFGYHLTNVVIHVLAGLTLLGIVRRTLLLPGLRQRFGAAALPLALATSLLWSLHPLNVQAVAYVTQRYESLMGLLFLVAIYATIRSATSSNPRVWSEAAVLAALLALGSKEVAVSLPIVILLYDRAFLAGSFREAWRRRWGMYLGLIVDWALFAVLQIYTVNRGAWAGYALPVRWFEYLRSQPGVILHYLRLAFWPAPLVFDYQWPVAKSLGEILPGTVIVGGLAMATVYALLRRPKWGVLGAAFFLILAPTSSVMPLSDLAVEHRMYLPLTTIAAAAVLGGFMAFGRLCSAGLALGRSPRSIRAMAGASIVGLAVVLAATTWKRSGDFRSELRIWGDTAAKMPGNARAHNNLGVALGARGRADEAIEQFNKVLELQPDYADAHSNLGMALAGRGQFDEAIAQYQAALRQKPNHVGALNNLGLAYSASDRLDDAIEQYSQALEIQPHFPDAHNNLGLALAARGRIDEATAHYRDAVSQNPAHAQAHNNLGLVLLQGQRVEEGATHFMEALKIDPNYADAHNNLGGALLKFNRADAAIEHFQQALQVKPDYLAARANLAVALGMLGRFDEAIVEFRRALLLDPKNARLQADLAKAIDAQRQFANAIAR